MSNDSIQLLGQFPAHVDKIIYYKYSSHSNELHDVHCLYMTQLLFLSYTQFINVIICTTCMHTVTQYQSVGIDSNNNNICRDDANAPIRQYKPPNFLTPCFYRQPVVFLYKVVFYLKSIYLSVTYMYTPGWRPTWKWAKQLPRFSSSPPSSSSDRDITLLMLLQAVIHTPGCYAYVCA